jgi:Icc-related predicted phosphoesterase
MTRLVLMSDLHDRPATVPAGDVLVLAGDVFCGDDRASLQSDLRWVASLGFKRVLMTLGNHDLNLRHLLNTQPKMAHRMLGAAGITLLRDAEVVIEGIRFFGVDWRSTATIPKCDVLISHEPPAGILDGGIGCPVLRRAMLAAKPRLHVFGHCHEHAGHSTLGGTHFYNAAGTIWEVEL